MKLTGEAIVMQKPIKTYLFADADTAGSVLYGLYDALSIPGVTWPKLVNGRAGDPLFDIKIVAAQSKPFQGRGGILIQPHLSLEESEPADLICVPNITVPVDRSPRGRFPGAVEWLRRNYEAGATIGSACSGAVLLAEAGLLNGEKATTHWAYRELFRTTYPDVSLRLERIMVFAGEGNRIVTAGGFGSWQDLALHFIARFCGNEHAVRTAKVYVFCDHQEGQLPYAAMARHIQHSDQVIGDCQRWVADNYMAEQPVAQMIELSGLNRNSFVRRFKAATGYRPLEYVQTLRVEEAKQMLETGDEPTDRIASQVGYGDPRSFRRVFRKYAGLTPSTYRKRFTHERFQYN